MTEADARDARIAELERENAELRARLEGRASAAIGRDVLEQLRESESFYRQTLESIPSMVFTATPDGEVDYVSEQWTELTGVPTSRLLGDGLLQVVHPEDRERARAAWRATLAGRKKYDLELRICRADGDCEWFKVRGCAIRNASGGVVRWFGVAVNVDDLKRSEAARARAQEALAEADRRKDEFLAALAHELRNPLAPLRHGLDLLRQKGPVDAMAAKVLVVMERQLAHLVRLVDDLLDVARISRGMVALEPARIELRAIVEHGVELSRPLMDAGRHTLTVHVPDEPAWVRGDLTRLAQVIGNLLNNAAKYTPPGGHVALRAELEGDAAVIRVVDDGIGIEAEMLPRVFGLFVRADGSLTRAQSGLGIGLSLARRLVELHGGSLEAESPGVGQGSTFTVRLPLAAASGE